MAGWPSRTAHPIPIGYRATKWWLGDLYLMRTEAGPRGPLFTVSKAVKGSCEYTAESPQGAWQQAALDNCRLDEPPAYVDGRSHFGFTSQLTLIMLRALVPEHKLRPMPAAGEFVPPSPFGSAGQGQGDRAARHWERAALLSGPLAGGGAASPAPPPVDAAAPGEEAGAGEPADVASEAAGEAAEGLLPLPRVSYYDAIAMQVPGRIEMGWWDCGTG